MKGSCELKLDRANVMEAVEDWLEKQLAKRPRVTAVDQDNYQKDQYVVLFTHDPKDIPM